MVTSSRYTPARRR
uniref:Uncharacterized protein n=1 Tax=Arundo donax TaxID=35708 RepID=A0A0A9CA27_ARUDO